MLVALKCIDNLRRYLKIPDERLKRILEHFVGAVYKGRGKPLINFEKTLVSILESEELNENEKMFLLFWLGFEYGRHTMLAETIIMLYTDAPMLGLNQKLVADIMDNEHKLMRKKNPNT